jgi:hypothetical protein
MANTIKEVSYEPVKTDPHKEKIKKEVKEKPKK